MTTPKATQQLWQFSLRDFVEISAAIAPSAWCLTWPIWNSTDKKWLVGLSLTGAVLTLLVASFFRAKGWAYSLLFTYAGGLGFVIWLPARVALRFPEVISSEMRRVAILAMEKGQFALASAGLLMMLWLAGALCGHCLFRCIHRLYKAWFTSDPAPLHPSKIQLLLSAGLFCIDVVVVVAFFSWIGFDYSRPTIRHVRRIDPTHFVDSLSTKHSPFQAWTVSQDGKRLLAIDQSHLIHDIAFSSGEDRLAESNREHCSPIFSSPESISSSVKTIRECREGLLVVVYQSGIQLDGLSFQLVNIAANPPKVIELIENPKEMSVLGLSPSGSMLVTQSRLADLPGAKSLLVWNLETMKIEAELDPTTIGVEFSNVYVLLDDRGQLFAADALRDESETGKTVTIYSRDQEKVAVLHRVECLGDFEKPPLKFAASGKRVWGQFAGQRDFQTGIYPVIERVISMETQNPIESAASEYGGMNLVESLTFDLYHERILTLDFGSEFDNFNESFLGEDVDQFPIVGGICHQQIFRRRLRLSEATRQSALAITTDAAPLASPRSTQHPFTKFYSKSIQSAQFSQDGEIVVTVEDYDPMGWPLFDVWRLPTP